MTNYLVKKICCIGAGYVGGPTMAVFANHCPNIKITVVDINQKRIDAWKSNDPADFPIFEPQLDELILNCREKNLFFTTNLEQSIAEADMIFISVNTPTKTKGVGAGKASDLKWVEASARQIAKFANSHTIVVEKSTLPVKTAETIKKILSSSQENNLDKKEKSFSVLSNPEFLSEGNAINDLENPDRVLIGGDDEKAIEALSEIYSNWVPKNKILKTNIWSSELSKLTANAFLAQRISSINSISALCESTGADINQVKKAIGMDTRIGEKFLSPGPGFGGSCFQKDILNLVYLSSFYKLEEVANYWQGVIDINNWQKSRISRLVVNYLFGNVSEKKIAILGFAFKANTNDTRQSPSIDICKDLLEEGAHLSIYDPKVENSKIIDDLQNNFNKTEVNQGYGSWEIASSVLDASKGSDAIILLTEWNEFLNIDWKKIIKLMRKPAWVFDTRSCIDHKIAREAGFNVWKIGNSSFFNV
ncbi:nucleotide sugar dehydrogenase [uncultured Prochlorococcus sp.]|uniref:nucleotide sugar dehydrogenase n=1 Tax=uncultured Prochlorococcus sp. TaxID=159733 RepID=UPI00258A7B0C|nr:nucleotide sugar dehydrogenase [uncultured Prochlorococcus sp.]